MLRQSLREIAIPTRGRGFYEFTGQVAELLREENFKTGLATLHLRHLVNPAESEVNHLKLKPLVATPPE